MAAPLQWTLTQRKSCERRLDSNISWYFYGNAVLCSLHIPQMGIDQVVDSFRGNVDSLPMGVIGPTVETFNKMPIELLNGNERFVVFNISKIIPGGKRAHTHETYILTPSLRTSISTLILIFMCIFANVQLTTYRNIIITHTHTQWKCTCSARNIWNCV